MLTIKKSPLIASAIFLLGPILAYCVPPRNIDFGGIQWGLRQTSGPVEPGPNTFSNAADQIWVDDLGFLHLTVSKRSDAWTASELMAKEDAGYGTYTFVIDGAARNLDPNIVFGFFTWDKNPELYNREIDIELSRWGKPAGNLGWFSVQPSDAPGNQSSFSLPPADEYAFKMSWQKDKLSFACSAGGKTIGAWTYEGAIPDPGRARLRINLWLYKGRPPSESGTREIIVKSMSFTPTS